MTFDNFLMILTFLLGFSWAHALQQWQKHRHAAKQARLRKERTKLESQLIAEGWMRPWPQP